MQNTFVHAAENLRAAGLRDRPCPAYAASVSVGPQDLQASDDPFAQRSAQPSPERQSSASSQGGAWRPVGPSACAPNAHSEPNRNGDCGRLCSAGQSDHRSRKAEYACVAELGHRRSTQVGRSTPNRK
eukprot:225101-Chlamydomonas_euryale.AAC.12